MNGHRVQAWLMLLVQIQMLKVHPSTITEWRMGEIFLDGIKKVGEIYLRYNVYFNQTECQRNGRILVAKKDMVTPFTMRNEENQKTLFNNVFSFQEHLIDPGLFKVKSRWEG